MSKKGNNIYQGIVAVDLSRTVKETSSKRYSVTVPGSVNDDLEKFIEIHEISASGLFLELLRGFLGSYHVKKTIDDSEVGCE